MISFIIKSSIRKRIILLFIYNRDTEFFLSEIAKKVNTTPGTAQRELNTLIKTGFIKFRKDHGRSNYILNKNFILLDEYISIIEKTIGIEEELKNALQNITGIKYALIYGSYAVKKLKSDSDIDLMIIGDTDEDKIYKVITNIEKTVNRNIDYSIISEKEFNSRIGDNFFYKEILKKYILVKGDEGGFKKGIKESYQRG